MNVSADHLRKARFWKKFLRLTRGRIPVLRALDIIAGEQHDASFRDAILALKSGIEGGKTLSEAMKEDPSEFSACVRELVRAAENTGAWDEVLPEIADGLADGTFD